MKRICDFIAKWMGVIVLMVAALSLFVPASLTWLGTWIINPMLGIIMFGIGYLVGRLLRLQQPKCVALSIEVGMQNSGLATSLAVMHFAAFPLATIPGAVFSVWHNISGAIVARIYTTFAVSFQSHLKHNINITST